jgi:uncharacterized membrane protein YraQ (UPF0718 family)
MSHIGVAGKELAKEDVVVEREEKQPSLIDWKSVWKPKAFIVGIFLLAFYLPLESKRFTNAILESFALVKWYAREHVLLCLVTAFFTAGAISCFVSQAAVMR